LAPVVWESGLIEAADGSVTLPKPTSMLTSLVVKAHQSGVRVLLSIGGWNDGDASGFNTLCAKADARTNGSSGITSDAIWYIDMVNIMAYDGNDHSPYGFEDQLGNEFYNGIPTVQAKTSLAMTQGGGIMAWDLSQDTRITDLSLVSAIFSTIHTAP
jgi:GH18 family chitinase